MVNIPEHPPGWDKHPHEWTAVDVERRKEELQSRTSLSDREAEVVAWKETTITHQAIADRMGIEKGTVDSHAHRARQKYNLAKETIGELRYFYDGGRNPYYQAELVRRSGQVNMLDQEGVARVAESMGLGLLEDIATYEEAEGWLEFLEDMNLEGQPPVAE